MPTLQLIPRNETNQSERLAPLSESFELNGSKVCAGKIDFTMQQNLLGVRNLLKLDKAPYQRSNSDLAD